MKKTAALLEKLIRLANGETLPASKLKGDWFEHMLSDGILLSVVNGSRKSYRVYDSASFRHYLASQYDIRNLEQTHELLSGKDASRAEQVTMTGDSKFISRRTFSGFLVNTYQPIEAMLNGQPIIIHPPEGSYLFIADYWHLIIPDNIVIVGVENAENFRYVERQKYLFKSYENVLFVSRYPQVQSKDLLKWLQSIPNRYVHFGDLDLAGIAIYQNEFYRHLGERSSFLIPNDYEFRIANGNTNRYNTQLPQYEKMVAIDKRIEIVLACIHKYHRGYDQEGFIERIIHNKK